MAVLAAAVTLAACTPGDEGTGVSSPVPSPLPGSPDATPDPSTPTAPATDGEGEDACALLSPEDVGEALGEQVGGASAGEAGVCAWEGGGSGTGVSLSVVPVPDVSACTDLRPEGAVPVEGLGVPAWWDFVRAEIGVGSLVACPKDRVVTVALVGAEPVPLRASAEELMEVALSRL